MRGPSRPGMLELMIILCFVFGGAIGGILLMVLPFLEDLREAGFPWPLPLLTANIILAFYLAFTNWPALRPTGGPLGAL